jgi:hypothetical protein
MILNHQHARQGLKLYIGGSLSVYNTLLYLSCPYAPATRVVWMPPRMQA